MSIEGAEEVRLSYREHERMLDCRSYVLSHLIQEMQERGRSASWVENERLAVATSANEWAGAHGYERRVTVDDVERIEGRAAGHADYASKLALYVAEFVVYATPSPQTVAPAVPYQDGEQ